MIIRSQRFRKLFLVRKAFTSVLTDGRAKGLIAWLGPAAQPPRRGSRAGLPCSP
jgi:hypothetical protein